MAVYTFVGLGNPQDEYDGTRHNTGNMAVEALRKVFDFEDWSLDKRHESLVSRGVYEKEKVVLMLPQTYMNKSGKAVVGLAGKPSSRERLVVIHDDLDIPFGSFKISFGKHSGGHRGVDSIVRSAKSRDFIRIRIGISKVSSKGKLLKPKGEQAVEKWILGAFTKDELSALKRVFKKVGEASKMIIEEGRGQAMNQFN